MGAFDELVELGYDAVAGATAWPQFLRALNRQTRADFTAITTTDLRTRTIPLVRFAEPDPEWESLYASHYAWIGPVSPEAVAQIPVGLSGHIDFPKEFYRTEFYNEWMAPRGMHHVVLGLVMLRSAEGFVVLSSSRTPRHKPLQRGAVDLHARVVQQLGWAFHLRERLQRANGGRLGIWRAWETSLQAVAMLDVNGRVGYLNPAAARLLAEPCGLNLCGNRLTARRGDDDQRLQRLVKNALKVGPPLAPSGDSLVLRDLAGAAFLTLHVHPLNVGREEIALGGPRLSVIVFLTSFERVKPVPVEGLRTRFGLTEAEARLALTLEKTESLRDAAASMGITYATARARLQIVFDKTGTRRQSSLVRLLFAQSPTAAHKRSEAAPE